ncbi:hypothetical protein A0J61_09550 [Choanephora cucurbitarum]|uniref:Uncharacterized protein n=1 Tax=Choanephora cucurbitarum TaxID=101091 RepID=A0A1C7MZW0_9FUNG|nr:hypothetical protein A0J61_09550 [Choanephora cucurbitarum]
MLRVSSILYLEKVWSPPTVALLRETRSIDTSMDEANYTSEAIVKGLETVISSSHSVSTVDDDSPGMTNSLLSASSSVGPETPQQPTEVPNVTSDMIHSVCQYDEPVQSNASFSSRLSPKRILRGSRSNLKDDPKPSRRRSLFLEKFSHHPLNQEIPPLPNTDTSLVAADPPSSLAVFRRKSAKLSTKGKSLSKRIRRVISFHH